MNTVKEFIKICDERLKLLNMTRAELFKKANLSEPIFIMAMKRNSHLKIENIETISNILGISIQELLGLKDIDTPKDIKDMEDLLLKIPEKDRKFILLVITSYYRVLTGEKL